MGERPSHDRIHRRKRSARRRFHLARLHSHNRHGRSDRLLIAAGTAAVAVLLIWFRSRTRYAIYGLVGLCLIELTIFARIET
jgi:hypothetical protein